MHDNHKHSIPRLTVKLSIPHPLHQSKQHGNSAVSASDREEHYNCVTPVHLNGGDARCTTPQRQRLNKYIRNIAGAGTASKHAAHTHCGAEKQPCLTGGQWRPRRHRYIINVPYKMISDGLSAGLSTTAIRPLPSDQAARHRIIGAHD